MKLVLSKLSTQSESMAPHKIASSSYLEVIILTLFEIRRFARRHFGRRVIVVLRSGRRIEGVIVFAGLFSLILRVRIRGVFVRRRIFYRDIARIILV